MPIRVLSGPECRLIPSFLQAVPRQANRRMQCCEMKMEEDVLAWMQPGSGIGGLAFLSRASC